MHNPNQVTNFQHWPPNKFNFLKIDFRLLKNDKFTTIKYEVHMRESTL